jgi:tRNA-2-methylthio-N6-dimethylallyladenosine synthase
VKDARLQALLALLRDQQAAFNERSRGLVLPVLFTGPGRRPGQLSGRSPYLQPVHVEAPISLVGQVALVTIVDGRPNSLAGTLTLERNCA